MDPSLQLESDITDSVPVGVMIIEEPPNAKVATTMDAGWTSSRPAGHEQPHGVSKNATYITSNLPWKSKASNSVDHRAKVIPIVSGQPVSLVEHQRSKGNLDHRAVALMEQGHGKRMSKVNTGGRTVGSK
ncbi:hypothetical protein V6N12_028822 [Hibiscus sabdariffa]|uniref:Uncharacterized protein n=1 Tax=Hibiscus sabdariffa TaxID=183260 RepID=A0ABR2F6Y4_9ROSI